VKRHIRLTCFWRVASELGYSEDVICMTTVLIFTVRRFVICLSVGPSVTLVDCVDMVRPTIMISSLYGSPILVSGDITFITKFEGGHPERGR